MLALPDVAPLVALALCCASGLSCGAVMRVLAEAPDEISARLDSLRAGEALALAEGAVAVSLGVLEEIAEEADALEGVDALVLLLAGAAATSDVGGRDGDVVGVLAPVPPPGVRSDGAAVSFEALLEEDAAGGRPAPGEGTGEPDCAWSENVAASSAAEPPTNFLVSLFMVSYRGCCRSSRASAHSTQAGLRARTGGRAARFPAEEIWENAAPGLHRFLPW